MSGLIDISELEELRLLLVEECWKLLHTFLEVSMILGPVVALIEVRNDDSPIILGWLRLRLHGVRKEIYCLVIVIRSLL